MKRLSRTVLAVTAIALAVAAGASADQPIKQPGNAQPFLFEGPTAVCPFPVALDYAAFRAFSTTHFDKAGDVRWIGSAGQIVETLTGPSGKSVELNSSGPGKLTFNDDGSATLIADGPWIIGYFATDSPSLSLLLYRGHLVLNISAEGTLTFVSYTGAPVQDVCAMLAP